MFERHLVVAQDKKRVMLILAILSLCLVVLVFFELFTGCTYQSATFKEFYCQSKMFSPNERISASNVELDITAVTRSDYKGETLVNPIISPFFIEITGIQPSLTWLKVGAILRYDNTVLRSEYQTTKPDYLNMTLMPSLDLIIANLTSNMPITSIYWWRLDNEGTVVYADGTQRSFKYFTALDEYTKTVFNLNTKSLIITTSFTCTSCFSSESFKFSDLWKLLVGVASLIGVCMAIIGMVLIDAVDYRKILLPNDENISLSNAAYL